MIEIMDVILAAFYKTEDKQQQKHVIINGSIQRYQIT